MSTKEKEEVCNGPLVDLGDRMPVLQDYMNTNQIPYTEEDLTTLDKMLSTIGKEYHS